MKNTDTNTDNNVTENGNGCEINQNDVNNSNSVINNKNKNIMETNENQKSDNNGFENQINESKSSKKDKKLSKTKKVSKSKGKIKSDKKSIKSTESKGEMEFYDTSLKSEIITMNIDDLTIHPLHTKIYGEKVDFSDIKLSLEKTKQSMTPIIINTENQILEGVRRYMCYKDLKYKTVDVIVKDITKEEILFTIITSNFHRKNDCLQTLNIFDSLMEIYSHQGKKTSVLNETEVDKPKKKEDDTTRKKVCDMIGFSYSTIDKLKKIKNFNIELFTKIDEGKKTIHKVYKSIGKKVKDTINIKTDYSIQNVSDSKLFKVRKYDETSKMDGIVGKQIQCVVTSPPKFVGEETDKKRYIDDITNRLKECHKIMKDDGSLYLIMDDIRSESGVMTNIPYEVLFGLIGFGYNHIDTIIWEYPTPPMINGKNLIQSYKYIFHLTKSLTYYKNEVGRNFSRNVIPTNPNGKKEMYDKYRLYKGKDWNKVWLSDNIIKTNMFETIPIGLILDSTKEGDYVMNPFDTDESVGLVSLFYNRKFFGFTDDEEYVKIQSGILHSFLIENRKDG